MIKVGDIYNKLDEIAPFNLSERWDNSGLLIGDENSVVTKAVLCLDITKEIALNAAENGVNLIISHHPLIFNPLKNILDNSVTAILIKNNISAICAHTNLDMVSGGINSILAEKLGIKITCESIETIHNLPYYQLAVFVPAENVDEVYSAMKNAGAGTLGNYSGCAFYTNGTGVFTPLAGSNAYIGEVGKHEQVNETRIEMILPQSKRKQVISAMIDAHPYEEPAYHLSENYAIIEKIGHGKIGVLDKEYSAKEFAERIKKSLGSVAIRYNDTGKAIRTVAISSGSGGSFINKVISLGIDAYITGDVKHDQFIDANNSGLTVFDAGHYHTENIFLDILKSKLSKSFTDIDFSISDKNRDILSYEF